MSNMKHSLYEWCITPSLNKDPEWGLKLLNEYTGFYDKNDTKVLRQNNKYNESLGIDLTPLSINQIAYGSGKKALWKCSLCGHKWFAQVVERTSKNINRVRTGCPKCKGLQAGASYGDTFIYSSLNQITNTSEFRKKFIVNNIPFEVDIYDSSLNLIIEYGSNYFHPNPVYSYAKQFIPEDNTTYFSTDLNLNLEPEDNTGHGTMRAMGGTMGGNTGNLRAGTMGGNTGIGTGNTGIGTGNTGIGAMGAPTPAPTPSLLPLAISLNQLEIPESTTTNFTIIKRKEITTQYLSDQPTQQELFLVYGSAVEEALYKLQNIPSTIKRLPYSKPICLIQVAQMDQYPTITVCNKPRLFKSLPEDSFLQLSYINGTLIIKNPAANTDKDKDKVLSEIEPIVLKCLLSKQNLYLMNRKLAALVGFKDYSEKFKSYNLFTKGTQLPHLFTDEDIEIRRKTSIRDFMKKSLAAKAGTNFINVYHCRSKQINDALVFINSTSSFSLNYQELTYNGKRCLIIRYTSDKNVISTLIMLEMDLYYRKIQLEFIVSTILSELHMQHYQNSINFTLSDTIARGLKP